MRLETSNSTKTNVMSGIDKSKAELEREVADLRSLIAAKDALIAELLKNQLAPQWIPYPVPAPQPCIPYIPDPAWPNTHPWRPSDYWVTCGGGVPGLNTASGC